jgi:parallel beta-helix repeat protein
MKKGHINGLVCLTLATILIVPSNIYVFQQDGGGNSPHYNNGSILPISQYFIHPPIIIDNLGELIAESSGGDGSPGNPYSINGFEINGSMAGACVYVGNVSAYFVISDCLLYGPDINWPDCVDNIIYFNNARNGTVKNNTIFSGLGTNGIMLQNSWDNNIDLNNISGDGVGLYLQNSHRNRVTNNLIINVTSILSYDSPENQVINNTISMADMDCVHFGHSNDTIFNDNQILNREHGLVIYESENFTISYNTFSNITGPAIFSSSSLDIKMDNNTMIGTGILVLGETKEHWAKQSIKVTNTVNGKPIRYMHDDDNITVPGGAGQIIIANCSDIAIDNQNVSGGWAGASIGFSSRIDVTNTTSNNNQVSGIYCYFSNNVSIENSTLMGNIYGIDTDRSNDARVFNNAISGNTYGISGGGCVGFQSAGNNISNNTQSGISLWDVSHSTITNNNLFENSFGGILCSGNDNTISANIVTESTIGIRLSGERYTLFDNQMVNCGVLMEGYLRSYWNTHSIATSNIVNGKPLSYMKNLNGAVVPTDSGQIILANCTSMTVKNRILNHTTVGVSLGHCARISVCNITSTGNYYGLLMQESNNNTINGSLFANSDTGCVLFDCDDNKIYRNSFIDNNYSAYDNTYTNRWNETYPTGGNYWSNYSGLDQFCGPSQDIVGSDSIGDDPHMSYGSVFDNYPLMYPHNQWESNHPTSSTHAIVPFWQSGSRHTISASASDDTNVRYVEFWYNFKGYQYMDYSSPVKFGNDSFGGDGWSSAFNANNGCGYYQFFSRACDIFGNLEPMHAIADSGCGYDDTAPWISYSNSSATTGDNYTIIASVYDIYTYYQTNLTYWFGEDGGSTLKLYGIGRSVSCKVLVPSTSAEPLNFRVTTKDQAGNVREIEASILVLDNDAPQAVVGGDLEIRERATIRLDATNSTDNIGIINYTWTIENDTADTTLYGSIVPFNFTRSGNHTVFITVRDAANNSATDSFNVTVLPLPDNDFDGIPDVDDPDDDNDGVPDSQDDFPLDPTEWKDTDDDGLGDNSDPDIDGDGVPNAEDAFPLDPTEWVDTDGDGIGNNADPDDDGDGIADEDDPAPLDSSIPGSNDINWNIGLAIATITISAIAGGIYLLRKKRPPKIRTREETI